LGPHSEGGPRETRLVGSEGNISRPNGHGRIDEHVARLAADHGRSIAGEIGWHLQAFFREVDKEADDVTTDDGVGFVGRQMSDVPGDAQQARLMDRRLSSVIGFFAYLETRTDNPRPTPDRGGWALTVDGQAPTLA
jgi:hypothetical protein